MVDTPMDSSTQEESKRHKPSQDLLVRYVPVYRYTEDHPAAFKRIT